MLAGQQVPVWTSEDQRHIVLDRVCSTAQEGRTLLISCLADLPEARSRIGWPPGWPGRVCSAGSVRRTSPSTRTSSCCAPRSTVPR